MPRHLRTTDWFGGVSGVIGSETLRGFDVDTHAYLAEAFDRVSVPKLLEAIKNYHDCRAECSAINPALVGDTLVKTKLVYFDITFPPEVLTLRFHLDDYLATLDHPAVPYLQMYLCSGLRTQRPINPDLERELHDTYARILAVNLKLRQVSERLGVVDIVVGEGVGRFTLSAQQRLLCLVSESYNARFDLKLPRPRGIRNEFDMAREFGPKDLQIIRKFANDIVILSAADGGRSWMDGYAVAVSERERTLLNEIETLTKIKEFYE